MKHGIRPGMKLLVLNGEDATKFGTNALRDKIAALPAEAPVEMVWAYRKGDWWTKANKLIVELDPPFGLLIPHGEVHESVIVQVDSVKARRAGIETGMRLMHIKQGTTDIFCKDLRGAEMIERISHLTPGVPATITLAEYGTEDAEFAMKAMKDAKQQAAAAAAAPKAKPRRPLSPP